MFVIKNIVSKLRFVIVAMGIGFLSANAALGESAEFFITTTNDATSLSFSLSFGGAELKVVCFDGGTLSQSVDPLTGAPYSNSNISNGNYSYEYNAEVYKIARRTNFTTQVTYTCTWPSAGVHTVRFERDPNVSISYNNGDVAVISFYAPGGTMDKIASASGSLARLFPSRTKDPSFYQTFKDAVNLAEIPSSLFSGGSYSGVGRKNMFYETFAGCTSLTSIPNVLFSGIVYGADNMFENTFADCTSLTEIPDYLFANIHTNAHSLFKGTFSGCTNIGGYIPASTFSGLISNETQTATDMWYDTFAGTNLLTTCPVGTAQYITGFEGDVNGSTWNGRVSCQPGCPTGYWGDGVTCTECSNPIPEHSVYSGASTDSNCPWACVSGYYNDGGVCALISSFTVTTVDMAANSEFTFTMTANGTFTVNCGDDGVLSGTGVSGNTITRSNTTGATYTCTYPTAGVHKITFEKVDVTAYNQDNGSPAISFRNNTNVAGISGSLGAVFPTITPGVKGKTPYMSYVFSGCTNLTGKIPANLFVGIYGAPITWQFRNMFQGCTSLEGPIPAGLFADIRGTAQQGVFGHMFSGCTSLKGPIPEGLFGELTGTANYLFTNTFYNCSSLDGTIPADLFDGISGAPADWMFRETFMGCESLTGWIPGGLFSGLTGNANKDVFARTFKGCTGLEGYIPPELFANITTSSATTSMPDVFINSGLATSCESFANTKQYMTGFENVFSGRVSCECSSSEYVLNPVTMTCAKPCDGTMYKGRCRQLCPVGRALFHAGEYTYPLWSDKTDVPSPVLHIRRDENTVCYVYLEPNVEGEHGLKLRFTDGNVYRAIDPR